MGPARVSLPPRRPYGQDNLESRSMANTNTRLGFSQNLRHNLPINLPQSREVDTQSFRSPISQLATNMVFQRVMPSRTSMLDTFGQQHNTTEPASFFQDMYPEILKQLQPPKQQLTPSFNRSMFQKGSLCNVVLLEVHLRS